jgi:5-methylcytosine-specific restriction endonuclease McrA
VPARRYTVEQFRTAVADPEVRTLADLCRALGIVPRGANYESVRDFGLCLGMNIDQELACRRPGRADSDSLHSGARGRRSYSGADLLRALEDPAVDGYPELCRALGLQPHTTTYARLRWHAEDLGAPIPPAWSRPGRRRADGTRPASTAAGHRPSVFDEEELRRAVAGVTTLADVIRRLGLRPESSTYAKVRRSFTFHGIDTAHLTGVPPARRRRRPLENILTKNSQVTSGSLRERLLEEGIMQRSCDRCGGTTWEGSPIPLELDHIDGDRRNNLLENLRLLCPNCHALTPTYRGRNIRRRRAARHEALA